jgi:hypothetical protein
MFSDHEILAGLHDVPNHQVIELENGNKLNLVRKDPYGFIYLHLDKGQLPASLQGAAFTDWTQAKQAAYGYVKQRQEAVAELKDKEVVAKRKLKD